MNGMHYQNGNTPQSVEPGGYDYSEYSLPIQQQSRDATGISPLSTASGGLPPAFPMRRRVDSSGDRSVGELSTVSGASGHNRVHRSGSSDGYEFVQGNFSSPTYPTGPGAGVPPKPGSGGVRSRSPKPPRRSRSPTNTPPTGAGPGHPLHQRRSSDEYYPNRHRRTHSYDLPREGLRRNSSSNSLYSLGSQGSVTSETLRLLPDPRWGGGSGGNHNRRRSYSGGSREGRLSRSFSERSGGSVPRGWYIGNINVSYSTDSMDQQEGSRLELRGVGYGSIGPGPGKEVIMNGVNGSGGPPRHRRTGSEVSATSYASGVSVDKSVEPAVLDMAKSALFKDVTHHGLLQMQLPKDNFRLLSDRDLESGCVYKRALVDNEGDYFQEYHLKPADDASDHVHTTTDCQCKCPNCENCHGRRKPLPPSYYVMAVDADIYRRMFDEVAESMNMPCKLFYCGHHEDVDYPSIGIAVAGVTVLFLVVLWITMMVDG
ncbi:hypothetical protein ACHAXT_001138 [Thalassiosira profunda]